MDHCQCVIYRCILLFAGLGKGKPKGEKAATLSLRIDNKQWGYWDRPFNFTRNPTCVYVLMTVSTVVASIVNAFSIRVPMFF
ncbi:hypothetical protein Csa_015536 [Cucumis sativus]|nr:hypothetical protein Csa_015536 [Cucumis sativus]